VIVEGSRYEDADVLMVEAADGVYRPTVFYNAFDTSSSTTFKYRIAKEGERFDTIAFELFQDPEYWWVIANLNPEIQHPADLTAGMIIRVPS
jgi:hypothetical protein